MSPHPSEQSALMQATRMSPESSLLELVLCTSVATDVQESELKGLPRLLTGAIFEK